ncbi:MAG: biotin--[acetyl-CoA-carboxylase] ligase [Saprospiraceae bacterium]|nr:biotin--[acetyl-CoA-carboxylase] ligase [Saprospiraceae bacterium]
MKNVNNIDTIFIGKHIQYFETLPSTNEFALSLVSKSKPTEGTVILTHNQTLGKGQNGSSWIMTPDKNIALSLILYPKFIQVREQFILSQAVAISVCNSITKYVNLPVKIKWPNDIYINNKKIAGILIQNSISGASIQHSIIGIGINVNQQSFADDLPHAGSIFQFSNKEIPLDEFLCSLCVQLEQQYFKLRASDYANIRKQYLSHLMRYLEESEFLNIKNQQLFNGVIVGTDTDGKLLIESKTGIHSFNIKEVQMIL